MRPSELVRAKAAEIRALTARYPTLVHPRVFGSAARGDDRPDSDIDILVDALDGTTLFDLGGLMEELKDLLGVDVDLVTSGQVPESARQRIFSEAREI
ncbi:putative nucleotidyltransferase [Rhizobium aquaticum]|uniref:Nucleotidyltransferase n=1 Tax=Rhizobium aquaticum TaxID=1549636 RepID=A0ABV2J1S8_9HYPH